MGNKRVALGRSATAAPSNFGLRPQPCGAANTRPGFEPMFVSILPRVHPTGLLAARIYEIDLPRRRRRKKVREYSRPGTAIRVKWPFKLSNIGSNWSCGP